MIHGAASGKCLREVARRCAPTPPPLRGWRSPGMVFCCRWFIRFALVTCEVISLTWRDIFHSAQQNGFKQPSRRSSWMLVLFNEVRRNHFHLQVAWCHAVTVSTVIVFLNYSFFTTILWIHIKFYSCCNLITDGGHYYIIHETQGSGWIINVVSNHLKILTSDLHQQLLCKQIFSVCSTHEPCCY